MYNENIQLMNEHNVINIDYLMNSDDDYVDELDHFVMIHDN